MSDKTTSFQLLRGLPAWPGPLTCPNKAFPKHAKDGMAYLLLWLGLPPQAPLARLLGHAHLPPSPATTMRPGSVKYDKSSSGSQQSP